MLKLHQELGKAFLEYVVYETAALAKLFHIFQKENKIRAVIY